MKIDLGADCISRDAVKYYIQAHIHEIITESGIDKNAHTNGVLRALLNGVNTMPSVTPQEPFKPAEDIPTITIPVEDYLKLLDAIPRERIEQMIAEIEKEAAESVYPECASLYWALDVIHKYTKENKQ